MGNALKCHGAGAHAKAHQPAIQRTDVPVLRMNSDDAELILDLFDRHAESGEPVEISLEDGHTLVLDGV